MKYEVLKRSHVRRNIIIAVLIIVLLLGIVIIKNRSNTLSNSSINKESITKEINNNLIGAYIQEGEEYKQTDDIPSSGYEFNKEKSYCKIGEDIQEDITLFYDMDTQTITVSPITKEGLKCYLYFDEKASGSEYILGSPNAPTNHTTDWTGKESYYYTGTPYNRVQFAGFYWRIIRINGDGSIRLIYADSISEDTIVESVFNTSYNKNAYVGYMYGNADSNDYTATHANVNSSTIKETLDIWYINNLTNVSNYIDGNAGFCGDRRVSNGSGIDTDYTEYQSYTRILNESPSLSCDTNDIYTTKESSTGNKALTYPIGLISADEAMFAGVISGESNNTYLHKGVDYWTMSPYWYDEGNANMFVISSHISLANDWVAYQRYAIPVINLRSDVELTGTGSQTDPFKVVGA